MSDKEKLIDPAFLLNAYRAGVFPMAMDDGEIAWFSPNPRGIIPLDAFHIPHGLKPTLKKAPFEIRFNTSFRQVMEGCADRDSTWIDEVVLSSYLQLHEMGHAKSVEAWQDSRLVGGLYGVTMGGAFFGESMFSRVSQASQVALVNLVDRLRERGFILLDTQWTTEHLQRFGAVEIPRDDYMARLAEALTMECSFD